MQKDEGSLDVPVNSPLERSLRRRETERGPGATVGLEKPKVCFSGRYKRDVGGTREGRKGLIKAI